MSLWLLAMLIVLGGLLTWCRRRGWSLIWRLTAVGAWFAAILLGVTLAFTGADAVEAALPLAVYATLIWLAVELLHRFGYAQPAHPSTDRSFGLKNPPSSTGPVKIDITSSSDEFDKAEFRIKDIRILKEESVIVSSEEVPLDNRFGSNTLSTELEFSHTATVTMRLDREHISEAQIAGGLRGLIEGQLRGQVQQRQGVDIGQQLTRRAMIRFEAAPHRLVRYRIHWMQNRRREIAIVRLDGRTLEVPFSLFHGLYHSVESVEVLPED